MSRSYFYLVGADRARISQEFDTPADVVTYADTSGLLSAGDVAVRDGSHSGPVPLGLFALKVREGLFPQGADLTLFNIPQEPTGFSRPLVATAREEQALQAGTLTQFRRKVERISKVYTRGPMKGQPKYLSSPSARAEAVWTPATVMLAFPCHYGPLGGTLHFSQYPALLFEIVGLTAEPAAPESTHAWDWVLDVRRVHQPRSEAYPELQKHTDAAGRFGYPTYQAYDAARDTAHGR